MKTLQGLKPNKAPLGAGLLLLAAGAGFSVAANADEPVYTMTTIVDAAYGSKITAGRYEEAIEKITAKHDLTGRFSSNTNLCVAYTKTGNAEKALAACDRAVALASEMAFERGTGLPRSAQQRKRNTYLSLSLVNLGVLHAVNGQRKAAHAYFTEALKVGSLKRVARVNLARLGDVSSENA